MNRRHFLHTSGSCVALSLSTSALAVGVPHRVMSHIERVNAALQGRSFDRPPYTIYRAFERSTPEKAAHAHLRFHESFNTDIVKVMNPYPFPSSDRGAWFEVEVADSPFPDQLKALQLIGKGLKGRAYFVDTIPSPFATAWSLFYRRSRGDSASPSEDTSEAALRQFREFQDSHADTWMSALEAITQSTVNHIRQLKNMGVSGAFVKIINTSSQFGTRQDYAQFSKPYDERIFRELSGTKLTILRLDALDHEFLTEFAALEAPVLHYSTKRTGISITTVRKYYSGTIMGGVDEISYDKLRVGEIRKEWEAAWAESGPRFIVSPGGPLSADLTGRQEGHLQDSLSAW